MQWVLECSPSGRGFLQEHGLRFARTPSLVNYLAALRGARRCAVLREANLALVAAGNQTLRDRAAEALAVPRLRAFYVGL